MIETLELALEALRSVEIVGKRMDGGNPKIDEAIASLEDILHESSMSEVQRLGQEIQPEWEGLTEEEFVYFCSYVDHDTLSQIENTLRDKNELR
jgi:hypothetical protein